MKEAGMNIHEILEKEDHNELVIWVFKLFFVFTKKLPVMFDTS